ncbi:MULTISPECIES: allophanate hydrolase [Mycobacteriaceae]|uniref:Amidase n=1 Tax=Mycolicibacterium neoaurum VKM Ac-1815D TaxID=700508 RepID=V5XBU3_MYCNE|nr:MULTISPECIES: allophanate hydrolase [Mycobacteriaceae]AHC25915.1 amidase [Mycolicibacterium neoaurum VKM Ac-1815D]AMO06319.1 amidase [Mycolicibacterium neoaurum]AXK75334.1 allophanate hydrolase [Mycolicibacterium neoaurum]KJQ50994.1 amidase [Mycolicibacterium neoaurum]KUM08300.1 amidase [Mycolicibacterium neoaurum]
MDSDASGPTVGPSVAEILASHESGSGSPTKTAARVADAIAARGDDGTWLSTVPRAELLNAAAEIERRPGARTLPLYGVPFGVKDSIDVAGVPTTLSCPDFGYLATETAPAVQRLLDAGALYVGKTNLDQFATGLNGTRTPHTIPRSVYGAELISGGSSSGSAVAVALGQVPFAVATDTAGSGRVPAALNGVIGFKPSRGLISTVGLVPACKSLDCITVMAGCIADVERVFDVMAGRDDADAWSRDRGPRYTGEPITLGLPALDELEFFGDEQMARAHEAFRRRLAGQVHTVEVSLAPFLAAGELLYQGPWVAERLVVFGDFLAAEPDSIHPVVRDILRSGAKYTAVDAFAALQRLQELRAEVSRIWCDIDAMVVPTIGTTFTVDEVLARPIDTNTMLGHYTHFGNLLDLLGVAIPLGRTRDGRPHSATVLSAARRDDLALHIAAQILDEPRSRATPGTPVATAIEERV